MEKPRLDWPLLTSNGWMVWGHGGLPMLNMSHGLGLKGLPERISGAMKPSVPHSDRRLWPGFILHESPKSMITGLRCSSSRMFSGLRSLHSAKESQDG